jgi:hypothetical protein
MSRNGRILKTATVLGAAVFVFASGASGPRAGGSQTVEMWAGHQVVFGETKIPILGRRETRSDSYVLAEVTKENGKITFVQRACRVTFRKVIGAQVRIPEEALLKLPEATFSFSKTGDGLKASAWQVGWGKEDVDRDGKPGLTVDVDAAICGGELYIASDTRSAAYAKLLDDGRGMIGKISVRVRQRVLDANSACLKMFSENTDETQNGGFVYRRVQDDASCASLLRGPWPIEVNIKR